MGNAPSIYSLVPNWSGKDSSWRRYNLGDRYKWPQALSDQETWQPTKNEKNMAVDSFLLRHGCSPRNITWQYLHAGDGSLPWPYSQCPDSDYILQGRNCRRGTCKPAMHEQEFQRYKWANWDGLGDPLKHDNDGETVTENETKLAPKFKRAQLPYLVPASENVWKGMQEVTSSAPHYDHTTEYEQHKSAQQLSLENRNHQVEYQQPESNNLLAPNPLLDNSFPGQAQSPISIGTDSVTQIGGFKTNEGIGLYTVMLFLVVIFAVILGWKKNSREKLANCSRSWNMLTGMDRANVGPWDPRSERELVVEDRGRGRYRDTESV